ncbi:MAG: hypothetical protein KF861_21170 [Planctomycetaceae bacterium]|nr:hypothetical protein [Planctomycetaceae bacterium]
MDDLVIKIADDSLGYSFYREVLVPCQLSSPTIHGTITLDGELFMVMDFIPHLPTTWHENWRYERAVDWLAMKDKRMSSVCSKGNP